MAKDQSQGKQVSAKLRLNYGFISILCLLTGLLSLGCTILIVFSCLDCDPVEFEKSILYPLVLVSYFALWGLPLFSIGFGIAGLRQKDRSKIIPSLGVGFSALLLLFFIAWLLYPLSSGYFTPPAMVRVVTEGEL